MRRKRRGFVYDDYIALAESMKKDLEGYKKDREANAKPQGTHVIIVTHAKRGIIWREPYTVKRYQKLRSWSWRMNRRRTMYERKNETLCVFETYDALFEKSEEVLT